MSGNGFQLKSGNGPGGPFKTESEASTYVTDQLAGYSNIKTSTQDGTVTGTGQRAKNVEVKEAARGGTQTKDPQGYMATLAKRFPGATGEELAKKIGKKGSYISKSMIAEYNKKYYKPIMEDKTVSAQFADDPAAAVTNTDEDSDGTPVNNNTELETGDGEGGDPGLTDPNDQVTEKLGNIEELLKNQPNNKKSGKQPPATKYSKNIPAGDGNTTASAYPNPNLRLVDTSKVA